MTDDEPAGGPSVAARDDLAGVVDLFGALTRAELSAALSELAFKQRTAVDEDAIAAAIDVAIAEYFLVPAPAESVAGADGDGTLLVTGPAAFPSLPPNAEDLPHILDVSDRTVDRGRVASLVLERLRDEVDAAIAAGDADRLDALLDVAYDVEAWAPVTTDGIRDRIADALDK